MRTVLLCLPLLLAACGDSSLTQPTVPPTPTVPAIPESPGGTPPVATAPKSACEKAFEALHRKPSALTTAGVVETVQPASGARC